VSLLADLTSRPVMGLGPALARIPFFMKVLARTFALFRRDPPDLAVLVDSPALNLIVGEKARRAGIPVLYYVCPQLWAWAPWRMARFRRACDGALTLFPFEAPFFREGGVRAAWAGHPLTRKHAEPPAPAGSGPTGDPPILALLPGSRPHDQEGNLPLMVAALRVLRKEGRRIRAVVGQDDPVRLEKARALLREIPGGGEVETTGDLPALLAGARLALVKSGTGSLEAALAGTPNLVLYTLSSPLLRFLGRRYLSVPWVAAANLAAGREVVPELLLVRGEEEALARAAARLWDDETAREKQREDLREVRARLLASGEVADPVDWIRSLLGRDPAPAMA